MARVLVIGGTLFIGKNLVERLLDRGDEVTILHRGARNPFEGRAAAVRCDRNDGARVAEILAEGDYELVFDNVYDWERGTPAEAVEQGARGAGPSLRRYVFTSSVAAYAEGENHDEDDPLAPPDFPDDYCRNKAESERALFRLHAESGFPAATLRPAFIYGPGNPFYREQFFWDRLLADRPIIVPEDGERRMHMVLIDDLVGAALLAADRPEAAGRAYNVGHERPVTQNQLVEALARAAGKSARIVHAPRETLLEMGGRVFEPPFYFGQYFDMPPITEKIDRARAELGFEPTSFEEGLERTFAWYKSLERAEEPDFSFDDRVLAALE